jgi:NAD(P)-dependent dehydrogenase (short-subunit alcohol dehydrogenase family)
MPDYSGKTAIVTGAGHGIGRAIAKRLAEDGAAIGVIEINAEQGRETVELLRAAGHRAELAVTDITDAAAVDAAIAEFETALGPVDLLVNNAAFTDAGDIDGISLEDWHKEINVNLNGTYHCLRAVLPRMKARGSGAVVNISSVNGVRYFGNPAYSAAKAAITNLTQSVASEYGKYGVRCNAVMPGSVRTQNASWEIRVRKDPDVFKKLARWYPMGRVAEPEDIAKAVSFLGSDDASYITGVALPVDGGLLAGMNVMIDEFILESKD